MNRVIVILCFTVCAVAPCIDAECCETPRPDSAQFKLTIMPCKTYGHTSPVLIVVEQQRTPKDISYLIFKPDCFVGNSGVTSYDCNSDTEFAVSYHGKFADECMSSTRLCRLKMKATDPSQMCLYKAVLQRDDKRDGRRWVMFGHLDLDWYPMNGACMRPDYQSVVVGKMKICRKVCQMGLYGDDCKKRCRCENVARCGGPEKTCELSQNVDGVTVKCQDPYDRGINCNKKCNHGYWGHGSWIDAHKDFDESTTCTRPCNCLNDAACYSGNGTCSNGECKPSYYGKHGDCSQRCGRGKYGNIAHHGGVCHMNCDCLNNTDCYANGTCQARFKNPCKGINYGYSCDKKCHCLGGGRCNNKTGECKNGCDLRHYGQDCQKTCPTGRFLLKGTCTGACHCKEDICNITSGRCPKGCRENYLGYNCQRPCKYGSKCTNAGKCFCLSGKQHCNSTTGKCPDGCAIRWRGNDCQEECNGFWGRGCKKKCLCKDDSQCIAANGTCLLGGDGRCPGGMYGVRCQSDCKLAPATSNIAECDKKVCGCLDPNHCDLTNKKCSGKCKLRYTGGYGNTCKKSSCKKQNYLVSGQCIGECHCINLAFCDVTNGKCHHGGCNPGWIEPECVEKCRYGKHCPKPCKCYRINEMCDPWNGDCSSGCAIRNHGDDCQDFCPDGRFNNNVVCEKCRCALPHMCRATDGECVQGGCINGWEGKFCNVQCKFGIPSDNCITDCYCRDGHRCNRVSGECRDGCALRYYGKACDRSCKTGLFIDADLKCKKHCHCLNSQKCNVSSGECIEGGCTAGWEGDICQKTCTRNTFGRNCKHYCHCRKDAECDLKSGVCGEWHHRWYGSNCQQVCPSGIFLLKGKCDGECHCKNIGQCHIQNGSCLDRQCSIGWQGAFCNETCHGNPTKYGPSCKNKCHCQDDAQCHHITGFCDQGCHHRYTGDDCNSTCVSGTFMNNNGMCSEECHCSLADECRVTDGLCMNGGCAQNAHTSMPYVCAKACDRGTYRLIGKDCNGTCHCRHKSHVCDPITGRCPSGCNVRYYGDSCNKTCGTALYRDKAGKCTQTCRCLNNSMCNVTSGVCDGWCIIGYKGMSCQETCTHNTYGSRCGSRCQCANNDKCHHITGKCPNSCNTRYYGDFCNQTCRRNSYLQNNICAGICHCADLDECEVTNGECGSAGCIRGRKGSKCQFTCSRSYGFECKHTCHCKDDMQCDIENGNCEQCHHRYTGYSCGETCPEGKYSPYNNCTGICRCFNNADCDVVTGDCPDRRCMSLRFAGKNCQFTCKRALYLDEHFRCSQKCHCEDEQQCNVVNGSCGGGTCRPGWFGEKCNQKCPDGKFGYGCSRTCHCKQDAPCEKGYGKCYDGCTAFYTGDNCQVPASPEFEYEQFLLYFGVCLLFALLAIPIGCIFAYRRKKEREKRIEIIQSYIKEHGSQLGSVLCFPGSMLNSSAFFDGSNISFAPVTGSRISVATFSTASHASSDSSFAGPSLNSTPVNPRSRISVNAFSTASSAFYSACAHVDRGKTPTSNISSHLKSELSLGTLIDGTDSQIMGPLDSSFAFDSLKSSQMSVMGRGSSAALKIDRKSKGSGNDQSGKSRDGQSTRHPDTRRHRTKSDIENTRRGDKMKESRIPAGGGMRDPKLSDVAIVKAGRKSDTGIGDVRPSRIKKNTPSVVNQSKSKKSRKKDDGRLNGIERPVVGGLENSRPGVVNDLDGISKKSRRKDVGDRSNKRDAHKEEMGDDKTMRKRRRKKKVYDIADAGSKESRQSSVQSSVVAGRDSASLGLVASGFNSSNELFLDFGLNGVGHDDGSKNRRDVGVRRENKRKNKKDGRRDKKGEK